MSYSEKKYEPVGEIPVVKLFKAKAFVLDGETITRKEFNRKLVAGDKMYGYIDGDTLYMCSKLG